LALAFAFAGDALAAGVGQGLGAAAVDDAAGFFLKSEPSCFAALSTFFASVETLELLWLVEPFCAVAAPAAVLQAACDAFCAAPWLFCARAFPESVRIIRKATAKENWALRIEAGRIVSSWRKQLL
jgi:hypothetical protein